MNFLDPRLPDRFWSKCSPCPMSGCWLWFGTASHGDYGQLKWGSGMRYAHRVAYSVLAGGVPEGLQLDHLCRVRRCVNPAHLEPVTPRVNVLRGLSPLVTKRRHALVTYCPRGHEYTKENTMTRPSAPNERSCRQCQRDRQRERWRKENWG